MKLNAKIEIKPATKNDLPVIQNLARFYVYDISKYCGITEDAFDWEFSEDGLYDCTYFNKYWLDTNCKSFLISINGNYSESKENKLDPEPHDMNIFRFTL